MSLDYLRNNQLKQAINQLNSVYLLDTKSSLSAYYLGQTYIRMGDVVNGEKYILKALEIFPGYRDAIYSLIDLYKKQNKMETTKSYIDEYLKTNPNDSSAINILNSIVPKK